MKERLQETNRMRKLMGLPLITEQEDSKTPKITYEGSEKIDFIWTNAENHPLWVKNGYLNLCGNNNNFMLLVNGFVDSLDWPVSDSNVKDIIDAIIKIKDIKVDSTHPTASQLRKELGITDGNGQYDSNGCHPKLNEFCPGLRQELCHSPASDENFGFQAEKLLKTTSGSLLNFVNKAYKEGVQNYGGEGSSLYDDLKKVTNKIEDGELKQQLMSLLKF